MGSSKLLLVGCLVLLGSACSSHSDNVCQDIGDCSRAGDSDWIAACRAEAHTLASVAAKTGCSSAYEAYYSCADSSFSCRGATSTFPGCDESLAALDRCLGAATSNTACVALTMAQTGCTGGPAPDAGVDGGPPPACTAARDCQARCYLNQVANVCAPRVDELENVTTCAASCPP